MPIPYYIILSDSEDESPTPPITIILSDLDDESPPHTPQHEYPEEMYAFGATTEDPMDVDPAVEEEEEEFEEPEEEDSDDESEEEATPVQTYTTLPPSHYHSSGPRTIRTARKSVLPPQTIFPPLPASPSPTPLSAPSSPFTPLEPYAPLSPPPTNGEPTLVSLANQVSDQDIRIEQLEHTVDVLSGPVQIEMMQQDIWTLEDRVQQLDLLTQELSSRTPAPGANHPGMIEFRLEQVEILVDSLHAQVRAMGDYAGNLLRSYK